jgi:chemotaxis protein methyltransferase CheR
MNQGEYQYIKKKIWQLIRIDLDNYKAHQMMRRLDGYISRAKAADVVQYCSWLQHDATEIAKLRSFLTINVTELYRDQMHFEILRRAILPELLENKSRLNIWSAGCSDGEEPYSIAIMLDELTPGVRHRIFATDIDKDSLSKAAAGGPYLTQEIRNIPQPILSKYFNSHEDGYWVNERIRDRIMFSLHDLTRDKFVFGFDLIICRNVTIYFSNETKRILSLKFLNALKENGVLFIGATETMLEANEIGFQRLYSCFYKKNAAVLSDEQKVLISGTSNSR